MGWIVPAALAESGPVVLGVWGTCFTWLVTALGAAVVFLVPASLSEGAEGKLLDASLGFAAGVMLAASYWSLLAPAIEMAEEEGYGDWSFVPAALGFWLGAVFVFAADYALPEHADDPEKYLEATAAAAAKKGGQSHASSNEPSAPKSSDRAASEGVLRQRKGKGKAAAQDQDAAMAAESASAGAARSKSWRRLILLVIAVTIHNFPEGLAVGVAFGAVGTAPKATLQAAEVLTFGIGIQNFPEGLAVSLPMRRMGYSKWWCFFYGQLSGMVEPLGGLLGAAAVQVAEPILPYALSFAAGAMVYVVVDSIVPEAQTRGNNAMATWGCMVGFLVMMTLDVALG